MFEKMILFTHLSSPALKYLFNQEWVGIRITSGAYPYIEGDKVFKWFETKSPFHDNTQTELVVT